MCLLVLGTARPGAAAPVDRVWILSPEWLILANDYMDETDQRIYEAERPQFDRLLQEQQKLEQGRRPDWTALKKREALWIRGYARFSDQHQWMRDPPSFSIVSTNDGAYAAPCPPLLSAAWVQVQGDRATTSNAPLRGCYGFEVGHYAFLRLPHALTNGATYRVRQKDGREAALPFDDARVITPAIKVNQVGYRPDAPNKYAYLGGWIPGVGPVDYQAFHAFELCRDPDGLVVFRGLIERRAMEPDTRNAKGESYSGEDIWQMDFSRFKGSGAFHIRVPGLGRSWPFRMEASVYGEAFYTAMRAFYHQRCGCPLQRPWTAWVRGRCHPPPIGSCQLPGNGGPIWADADGHRVAWEGDLDFAVIKATADRRAVLDIWGGWHDAADYDRRQSHHEAEWDLMGLYELNPAAFTDGQLNLPESGNGIPDVLDEVAYGLAVWRRAQRTDGAVCGRIETLSHPAHPGMPDRDSAPFFKGLETRESTMYHAASAAQLSRLLQPFDAAASADLLQSARRAYAWAMRAETVTNVVDVTVELKDKADGRLATRHLVWHEPAEAHYWPGLHASLQLHLATHDTAYLADAKERFIPYALHNFDAYPNYLHHTWGLFALAKGHWPESLKGACTSARQALIARADAACQWQSHAPYRHPWDATRSRRWGFALVPLWARYSILAWHLTGDPKYLSSALLSADFHLGCNALGLVQTTGIGTAYPCEVQDAESRADGLADPIPGLTPYGVVSVPRHVQREVYGMDVPEAADPSTTHRIWFLPHPFDRIDPPIPLWRQVGPSGRSDPLNNEFTVQETLSPTALLFGALMDTGWRPSPALMGREPVPRDKLGGWLYPP
jgi:endoglucanase